MAGAAHEFPLAVEWDIRDDNSGPDLTTLRAAYRPAGVNAAPWIELPVQQLANGQQAWTPVGNAAQYEVRVQVRDKATKAPFARSRQVAERVVAKAASDGLLILANSGCVDGVDGDNPAETDAAPPSIRFT